MAIPSVGGGYQVGDGNINEMQLGTQSTPTALTTSATLTAAQLATQLLTANQAGGATATYTLPTGTLMDAYFTNAKVDSSFDFYLTNISAVAAEDVTIAAGTGFTVVGNMTVASNAAATDQSAGTFRARRTAANTWVLYRIS